MVDPVVSSKYGKRPILEVPALHVESGVSGRQEVSSLQTRPKANFSDAPSLIYKADGLNEPREKQTLSAPAGGTNNLAAPGNMFPMYSFPPHGTMPPPPPHIVSGGLYGPPSGPMPYGNPAIMQPQMPPMMNFPPVGMQAPNNFVDASGNMAPAHLGYPMMPSAYPGVHNPYPGQGYFPAGVGPQQGPGFPYSPYGMRPPAPMMPDFRMEGVLEFGQLTTVHFRDRTHNFQGLPEFLRRELQKTYGKFPITDIRIVSQNGEFHIYATPRNEGDVDGFSEHGFDGSDRLVGGPSRHFVGQERSRPSFGFNEVRGEPRDYTQR